MFCSNCGTQFPDEAKVCPVCGKVVESAAQVGNNAVPTHLPVSVAPEPPKKSNGHVMPIAIVAGVLAVVVLLTVGFWDYFSNAFAKTFLPADEYYTYVEKSNVENTVSKIYDFFGFGSSEQQKEGFSGSMKVEIGDAMKEIYDITGVGNQMDWLEEVEFAIDGNYASEGTDMKVSGKLNGVELISGEMIMNMEKGEVYVTVPELMSKYIRFPLAISSMGMPGGNNVVLPEVEQMPSDDYYGYNAVPQKSEEGSAVMEEDFENQYEEAKEMMENIKKAIPSEKVATKLAVKYFELITECIEDAEKKSEKLDIKGVKQSCTTVTVEINGKFILNALEAVLKEAKTDKEIKNIIRDMAEAVDGDPDDAYEAFKEGVEDALDALEDVDADDIDDAMSDEIVLKNWISADGEIVARQIEIGEVEIMIASIEQGTKVACEYSAEVDGMKIFELKGSGKKTMKGILTAKYDLEVSEKKVLNFEVEDFDTKKYEKDGYINGKFYFSFGDDVMAEMLSGVPDETLSLVENLTLGFDVKSDEKELSLGVMILNKKNPYITWTIAAKKNNYSEPAIPSGDKVVDADDTDALQEMMNGMDPNTILDKLKDAGVPSDLLDQMQNGGKQEEEVYPYPDYDW